MQINSIKNTTFGEIFVSAPMQQKIKELHSKMPKDTRPDGKVFRKNWNRCLQTKEFDLLITDDKKVFLLDKNGQRVMQEKMLSKFVWNIDTALKRILMFEDANLDTINRRITKYD